MSNAQDIRKALEALMCAQEYATFDGVMVSSEWIRGWDDCLDYVIETLPAALSQQPQAAQPEVVAWIDPADFAEMRSKENRGLAHSWTLPAERMGRCTMPLYATAPAPPQADEEAMLERATIEAMLDQQKPRPAPSSPVVCPECDGPLQWRCPACRIAQRKAVADPSVGELPPLTDEQIDAIIDKCRNEWHEDNPPIGSGDCSRKALRLVVRAALSATKE
jgi:hypothetical protein